MIAGNVEKKVVYHNFFHDITTNAVWGALFSDMKTLFLSIFSTLLIFFVVYKFSGHQDINIIREETAKFMTLLRREQADKVGLSIFLVYIYKNIVCLWKYILFFVNISL